MINYDSSSSTSNSSWSSGTSLTWSHTCTGNNLYLVVGITNGGTSTDNLTGVTYNGVAMTRLTTTTFAAVGRRLYLYGLVNPTTGANNIIASFSGSQTYIDGRATSYTGVKQTGQPDATAINNTDSVSSLSNSITTVANNSWIVAMFNNTSANTNSRTNVTSRQYSTGSGSDIVDSNTFKNPATSYSISEGGSSSGNWGVVTISLSPQSDQTLGEYLGAGSGTTKLLLHLNGSSADSSGNNNNGTDTAITYSQANGKFGQGAGFNGSTSKIVIGTSSTLNFERTDSFTISGWVKTTSFNNGPILSKLTNSGVYNGYEVLVVSGNIIFLMNNTDPSNGISITTSSNTMSTGSWYNVVVTYSGTSLASGVKVYINSVLCSQTVNYNNLSASILSSVAPQVGTRPSGNVTNGAIDEVIVENVAWSAEKVKKYYTYNKGRFGII